MILKKIVDKIVVFSIAVIRNGKLCFCLQKVLRATPDSKCFEMHFEHLTIFVKQGVKGIIMQYHCIY